MFLFDILADKATDPDYKTLVAIAHKSKGSWKTYTYEHYHDLACRLSVSLLKQGVAKGDRVGSVTANRSEWNILDMALLQIGAIHVALFPSFNKPELTSIINETEMQFLFAGSSAIYKSLQSMMPDVPTLQKIWCFDDLGIENVYWIELLNEPVKESEHQVLNECRKGVSPEDVCNILYTSGTTNRSNGVAISYQNKWKGILYECEHILTHIKPKARVMSFLPVSHCYENYHTYAYLYLGAPYYYADSMSTVIENLHEIKPVAANLVPLLLDGIYQQILSTKSEIKEPELQAAFDDAIAHACSVNEKNIQNYRSSAETVKYDALFYRRWRDLLGGNIKHLGAAGAKLSPMLAGFFLGIGIPILEIYGISESLHISVNYIGYAYKAGTTGKILPYYQYRVSEEGELLLRGTLFKEYYRNPTLTQLVRDNDDWYHTNDIVTVDEDGFVTILGRKNNFVKLASGRYLNLEEIEKMLLRSPQFSNAIVVLDDTSKLMLLACTKGDLTEEKVKEEIDLYYNKEVPDLEKILKWTVVPDTWSTETGELTPTLKIKRGAIKKKYLTQL